MLFKTAAYFLLAYQYALHLHLDHLLLPIFYSAADTPAHI